MSVPRLRRAKVAAAFLLLCSVGVAAQPARSPLALEPLGISGEAIFPAFEGWGPASDGETVLLLGYYNRNVDAPIDIPIGPNNRIEPGGPDYGQPTHFETGRQYGVFAIRVPGSFGTNKLTWTLTANGQVSTVSFWLNPKYFIDFFKHHANGNEPPVIRFAADGPMLQGPPRNFAKALSAAVGKPIELTLWVSDQPALVPDIEDELAARNNTAGRPSADGRPDAGRVAVIGGDVIGDSRNRAPARAADDTRADITANWRVHRGAGAVAFSPATVPLVTRGDPKTVVQATTMATFSTPGEYVLRAQVNDSSGDGGSGLQCCWTTALVKVNVR